MMNVADMISADDVGELLKELIRVKTVEGRETEAAKIIMDLLDREGISSYELIESAPGRGNLIIDLEGKEGKGFNLMIIGHFDVVPVESEWSVDPFGGVEKDGYIYGRGAIDDKGQVAAMAYLAVFLHKINYRFRGRVRLVIVADEETQNPQHGMRYLVREHKELFEDIDGAIGELGGLIMFGGSERQLLIFGEKGAMTLKIYAYGDKGHASQTYRVDNSVLNIARATLSIPDSIYYISRPVKEMFQKMLGIKAKALTSRILNSFILRLIRDPSEAKLIHALTHITIAKTALHAGKAENVYPEEAELTLDIRFFPEQKSKEKLRKLIEAFLPKGLYKTRIKNFMPSTYSSTKTKLYRAIERTIMDFGYKPLPLFQVGSSDSAWVRQLGIPTYHFMITKRPIEIHTIHGTDERIWKKDLIHIVDGYWRLIQNLNSGR